MKRAILVALGLALLLALPAVSRAGDKENEELRLELEKLQKVVKKQDEKVKELTAYVNVMKAESAKLAKKMKFAKKNGYTYPAPHQDARKALINGLIRFADAGASGTSPKEAEPDEEQDEEKEE